MENKKLMIVDDDRELLSELCGALELNGYQIIAVQNPLMASDVAFETQPDVILLDLKMPGKNGLQLAYEIQQRFHPKVVPVIAMSAHFKEGYDMAVSVYGIHKCLTKPFSLADAVSCIEQAIWENKRSAKTTSPSQGSTGQGRD